MLTVKPFHSQVVQRRGYVRSGHAGRLARLGRPRWRSLPPDRACLSPLLADLLQTDPLSVDPQGIAGGLVGATAGSIPPAFPLKWRFVVGCAGSAAAALMYAFADDEADYWRLFVRRSSPLLSLHRREG
jgi:hypothetical protein